MIRVKPVGAVLLFLVSAAAVLTLFFAPRNRWRIEHDPVAPAAAPISPSSDPSHVEQDMSAGNSTLGFQALLALSQGTRWRVEGLMAGANASGITLQIPQQPKWSQEFITSFETFGGIDAHGAAMAWLGHIDLLKFVIQNRWGSALIMEDDVDWDVRIREQTRMIAKGVRELTHKSSWQLVDWGKRYDAASPYGTRWDVLWMGHCSDPPEANKPMVVWDDETVIPHERYMGLNKAVTTVLKEKERSVHRSINPVCSFAYAVSAEGAKKLLALASTGKGGAFDLMLMRNCQEGKVDCISVNPEIFDTYHPAGGDVSEVRAGDAAGGAKASFDEGVLGDMGHSDNILQSARCQGGWGKTCLTDA